MSTALNKLKSNSDIIFLFVLSGVLRLTNLGYSDYQGDEIKALFLPDVGQSFLKFLLDQRKGPIQFFITYLIKLIDPAYTNEFFARLPFALAGIFSVIIFYKFVKIHFGKKVGFYSSLFLATNGFFIAFSRMVQYQAFVVFFGVCALYFLSLAITKSIWKVTGLYLGLLFLTLSILSHYDGFFIIPFVGYLLFVWFRANKNTHLKHLVAASLLFILTLAIFYIPFVLAISPDTLAYWQNRVTGGQGKISSSFYLFQVYNPIYTIHIYYILGIIGAFFVFSKTLFAKVKKLTNIPNPLPILFVSVWFLLPFIFMEVAIHLPGTHIFNYILPGFIFMGFGLSFLENFAKHILKPKLAQLATIFGVAAITMFIGSQAYFVYVDHTREYPWESEKFLIWEFHKPSAIFHLSMFGFPYNRHWEEIKYFVNTNKPEYPCPKDTTITCERKEIPEILYSTNERRSIARYYLPFDRDTDQASYYVYIKNPQSFTDKVLNEKADYWAQNYAPVKTINVNGREMAKIYFMASGSLNMLKSLKY